MDSKSREYYRERTSTVLRDVRSATETTASEFKDEMDVTDNVDGSGLRISSPFFKVH